MAQEPPPRPVEVTVTGNLAFGAFTYASSGGSVSVSPASVRTYSGDVILLNLGFSYAAAIFQLVANPGTLISIVNGPDINLTGSNGGSMTLTIGSTGPSSPFVITTDPPAYTEMTLGGTLTVGNSTDNPPGSYSGTFELTFMQE
jgi:hypothetical protein